MCARKILSAISASTARCKFKKLHQKLANTGRAKLALKIVHLSILHGVNFPHDIAALKLVVADQ